MQHIYKSLMAMKTMTKPCLQAALLLSLWAHSNAFDSTIRSDMSRKDTLYLFNRDRSIVRASIAREVAKRPKESSSEPTRYLAAKALIPKNRSTSTAFAVDRLESSVSYRKLSTRDRSFCRLLVSTTERRLGQIDKVLQQCQIESKKKSHRVDLLIEAVLRLGAVQLLFLDVPPHADVKETVDLLRMDSKLVVPEAKIKFVNAILRRLSREGASLLATTAVSDNVAPWLAEEWKRDWGEDATERILVAAMVESPRVVTVKQEPGNTSKQQQFRIELIASQFEESEILPQGSVRVLSHPPGSIINWPLYDEGAWCMQDVSATLPAIALYQTLSERGQRPVSSKDVVDMCAAPGGKTAQLWNYGFASVTAVDVSPKRSETLKQNLKRLGINCTIVVADGTTWIPTREVAGVLLDAPCTATGTGSKRPDVLRRDMDFQSLLDRQYRLACHAVDGILQLGGIFVYATCSLLKSESEDQITKLLERGEGAKVETIPFQPGELPGFDAAIDENGWIRVLPGALPGSVGQCDGFFIARLQRTT
jgi:16S rRNA (cytosine967-C5)-methyltransferase